MLKLLKVNNFALIENLSIEFEDGLTIITGETGAGKSMIVQAIAALCGNRMDDVLIRSNKNFAEISGVFCISNSLATTLNKSGIEADREIIIRRKIERGKRQYAFINDQLVSLNFLKEIAGQLVDLISQNEQHSLFFPRNHLLLLDSFAELNGLQSEYSKLFKRWKNQQNKLADLLKTSQERERRIDYLKYQIAEIEKVQLKPEEEAELTNEHKLLLSSEKRTVLSSEIANTLYESDGSIIENLAAVKKSFNNLLDYDKSLAALDKELDQIISSIDEIYRQICSYRDTIDFSETRFNFVQERLATISEMKKKYGKTFKEIFDYLQAIKKELSTLELSTKELDILKKEIRATEKELVHKAKILSKQRQTAARTLEKQILTILSQLGMKKAKFTTVINDQDLNETGKDDVEFYISTNPGEKEKPLRKVASGGEISRIILSLKTILSRVDNIPTIIFDEVDTGIGGAIAEAVGELLAKLSKHHQIICITHLPQISIFADIHILVEKKIIGKQTYTRITKLNKETRKKEVARMLGGRKITRKTIEHAAEFLQKGKK